MDPNEALTQCREAAKVIVDQEDDYGAAEELAEHFHALDAWLVRGGFLPADWQTAKREGR